MPQLAQNWDDAARYIAAPNGRMYAEQVKSQNTKDISLCSAVIAFLSLNTIRPSMCPSVCPAPPHTEAEIRRNIYLVSMKTSWLLTNMDQL